MVRQVVLTRVGAIALPLAGAITSLVGAIAPLVGAMASLVGAIASLVGAIASLVGATPRRGVIVESGLTIF